MSQALAYIPYDLRDVIENIVTEDDEPVDNLFSEKQQTLLKRTLYSSWTPPPAAAKKTRQRRKFLAAANVGIFFAVHEAPLVPDFFLSLDVAPHQNWYDKEHRTYFVWEFGKVPELTLEIVSNRKGKELTDKLKDYARMGVNYYVVYDPQQRLSKDVLCVYELGFGKRYRPRKDYKMPELGLSLKLWQGEFEGHTDTWLRWCDARGRMIPTGEERAVSAEAEAQQATRRAASAEAQAQQAAQQAASAEAQAQQAAQRAASAEAQAQQAAQRAASAEAELEQLRAELTRLKRQPNKQRAK